ncbi:hypothetical protein MBLNU13_g11286t1 [Cladosporium sp. NU13]
MSLTTPNDPNSSNSGGANVTLSITVSGAGSADTTAPNAPFAKLTAATPALQTGAGRRKFPRLEKLALINYARLKIDAAARLRSYIFQVLRSEQGRKSPTTCCGFSRMNTVNDHDGPGPSSPSVVVFNCRVPDHSNLAASSLLEHCVLQVENSVLRLILPLSNNNPIDTGILRTVLRTLFKQLASLTHRTFPVQMPSILPNRKAFQHSLRVTGRGVQVVYEELWAVALQTGVLTRLRGYAASAGRLSELETLIEEPGERSTILSHDAAVQQLLWKSRQLADELRFWLALLRVGRSL